MLGFNFKFQILFLNQLKLNFNGIFIFVGI